MSQEAWIHVQEQSKEHNVPEVKGPQPFFLEPQSSLKAWSMCVILLTMFQHLSVLQIWKASKRTAKMMVMGFQWKHLTWVGKHIPQSQRLLNEIESMKNQLPCFICYCLGRSLAILLKLWRYYYDVICIWELNDETLLTEDTICFSCRK